MALTTLTQTPIATLTLTFVATLTLNLTLTLTFTLTLTVAQAIRYVQFCINPQFPQSAARVDKATKMGFTLEYAMTRYKKIWRIKKHAPLHSCTQSYQRLNVIHITL